MGIIYMDYNASTPVDEKVFESMVPFLRDNFGNPSSSHGFGIEARKAVVTAREQVAQLVGCKAHEVIFTSGGSESNNHAIKGAAWANRDKGNHIITSVIEHPAVINPCRYLETQGYRVTYLPVDSFGMVSPEDVEAAVGEDTILITIMHANNEVGTIQPLSAIGEIARAQGVVFHTDAAQSVGKIITNVDELKVDMLTIAGHKLYAPKGVGALYVRTGVKIENLIHGAAHEYGRRAGTENVAYMAGLGVACALAFNSLEETAGRLTLLRDMLHRMLEQAVGDIVLNGHPTNRLPNTLNLGFGGVLGGDILSGIQGLAASTGSACHEGTAEMSGVLRAMGVGQEYGLGSLRLSLGRYTTDKEVKTAAELITDQINRLRREDG